MRKLEALRNTPDGRDYTLSLVPWSLMRRLTQGREAKAVFGSVPHYELGILPGFNVFDPYCVFHFADKDTTREMYHKIAQAISQDGLHGRPLASIVRDADPRKVDARWAPGWQPMAGSEGLKDGEIAEAEGAEFNNRSEQYRSNVLTEEAAIDEVEKPGIFHLAAYLCALLIGGKFGWQFGDEFGGAILGAAGAALGAIVLSSLVGIVATLFGYRVR